MRTATIIALTAATLGCGASDTRTYQLTGQVLVVKRETSEVLVKHDDIPGFMPAMTMPYAVKNAALLAALTPGDLIRAELRVAPNEAFLSAIARTGSAPLPEDARTDIPPATNVQLLRQGDSLPDIPLFTDLKGGAAAITFIYTRCPLPQFCPLMDRRFAETQQIVASTPALAGKVRLLSISFDAAFDTDEQLRRHAEKLGADPSVWRFAAVAEPAVDRLAAQFGINVIREQDGTITHNLRTAIVDSSGRVYTILDNNAWTAEELARELRDALFSTR